MKKIIIRILQLGGILFVLYSTFLYRIIGIELGNVISLCFGLVLIFYNQISKIKVLNYLFIFGMSCFMLICSFLFIYGHNNNVTFDEDAVIVLGCGLRADGVTISLSLEERLLSAIEYSKENPEAIIVVSGGQGSNENVSESFAMKEFLVENGVSSEKVIMENKSTSTFENFEFSKEILDNYFNSEYKTAFITNDYHIFRASFTAKKVGYNSTHFYADTPSYITPASYFREVLAVVKYIVF